MGLPVKHMIVATNSNDILHRFFTCGEYDKHPVQATCSPSMDIGISSNFERYLFYLFGSDASVCGKEMEAFKNTGQLHVAKSLLKAAQGDFLSACASEEAIMSTITNFKKDFGYIMCPHTACGVSAVEQLRRKISWGKSSWGGKEHKMVVLATAHAGKFNEAVELAIGEPPVLPPALAAVQDSETRFSELPNSVEAVRKYIEDTVARRNSMCVVC
jgi:threonine synthase